MKRGDIYLVPRDPTAGYEQSGSRPVLVVSPAEFNDAAKKCWRKLSRSSSEGSVSMNEFRRLAAKIDQHRQQLANQGVSQAHDFINRMMGYVCWRQPQIDQFSWITPVVD